MVEQTINAWSQGDYNALDNQVDYRGAKFAFLR